MKAKLIWNHDPAVLIAIPEEMGKPKPPDGDYSGQLMGTHLENLCEIAGRVCYDSLGKGRDSKSFHKHLVEVGHWSVYEHARLELVFDIPKAENVWYFLASLVGIPGLYFKALTNQRFIVNVNLRHVLDWWERITDLTYMQQAIYNAFLMEAVRLAPLVVEGCESWNTDTTFGMLECDRSSHFKFATLFLRGSRGFSHEMVRHRYSMSQRSTRYVDEDESDWIQHPLLTPYLEDEIAFYSDNKSEPDMIKIKHLLHEHTINAKDVYSLLIKALEPKLIASGLDKLSARKQARGAARGYLGNALVTELVFTAPISGWKDMIRQRHNPAADKEIYCIFEQVRKELNL